MMHLADGKNRVEKKKSSKIFKSNLNKIAK